MLRVVGLRGDGGREADRVVRDRLERAFLTFMQDDWLWERLRRLPNSGTTQMYGLRLLEEDFGNTDVLSRYLPDLHVVVFNNAAPEYQHAKRDRQAYLTYLTRLIGRELLRITSDNTGSLADDVLIFQMKYLNIINKL